LRDLEKSKLLLFSPSKPPTEGFTERRFASRSEAVTVAVGFSPRGRRGESSVAERRLTGAWRVVQASLRDAGRWGMLTVG